MSESIVSDLNYWKNQKIGPKHYRVYYEDGSFDRLDFTKKIDLTDYPIGSAVGYICQYSTEEIQYGGRVCGPEGMIYLQSRTDYRVVEKDMWNKLRAVRLEFEEISTDPFKYLERELKRHDWTYHFSDDHRVWQRGVAHEDLIKSLMKKCGSIDPTRAHDLYEKYRKKVFGD